MAEQKLPKLLSLAENLGTPRKTPPENGDVDQIHSFGVQNKSDAPHRVQLRRAAGWRMPPNTVSVARPGNFGNPWTVAAAIEAGYPIHARTMCVQYFREWVTDHPGSLTAMLDRGDHLLARLREGLPKLRGKNLACWCSLDQPCHADVLLELANAQVPA